MALLRSPYLFPLALVCTALAATYRSLLTLVPLTIAILSLLVRLNLVAKLLKPSNETQLDARLRRMAHGDAALVERLLRNEKERHPNAKRGELLRRVLERWNHDKR